LNRMNMNRMMGKIQLNKVKRERERRVRSFVRGVPKESERKKGE